MGQTIDDKTTGQERLNALIAEGWAQSDRYKNKEYSQLQGVDQMAIDDAYRELNSTKAKAGDRPVTQPSIEQTKGGGATSEEVPVSVSGLETVASESEVQETLEEAKEELAPAVASQEGDDE